MSGALADVDLIIAVKRLAAAKTPVTPKVWPKIAEVRMTPIRSIRSEPT